MTEIEARLPVETPRLLPAETPRALPAEVPRVLPAETPRMVETPHTARAVPRTVPRATLQLTVHDFNGNIIKKAVDEDHHVVWIAGKNFHLKHTHPSSTDFAYSVPASFKRGGAFHKLHWESARPPPFIAGSANGFNKADRINAWAEEVHRRHVTRTARVRARLSPAKSRAGGGGDRVIPSHSGVSRGVSGIYESECSFTLSLPENGDRELDDARFSSLSRTSSRNDNMMTARSRPATTGRYFDSSNGLRNIRSSQTVFRSRPNTATPCSGPGLKIKKMTLHHKEEIIT